MTLTCHFNAKICFLRLFDWTRLRGFRRQLGLRESEKKDTPTLSALGLWFVAI